MTEKIKEKVQLPVWLLTLILSAIVGLFVYSITFAGNYSALQSNVNINSKALIELKNGEIKQLEQNKAEKSDVDRIYKKLDNIEQLLIEHISKK
jgi:hypothetical protein